MTADGSDDDCIQVQGLTVPYAFTDADGGSDGSESVADVDEAEHADVADDAKDEANEGEEEEGKEEKEGEDGMDSSDEEDDTDPLWSCGDAPDEPPEGYAYSSCPPLETEQQHRDLIGRRVLIAHERTKSYEAGWYMGRIKLYGVSSAWKKAYPSANFLVKFTEKDTDNAMDGNEGLELAARNDGRDEWWLLLDTVTE